VGLLAPTEKGVARTTRYEQLREGVQECEARIVVERAVRDKALREKLGETLAVECEKALEEHLRAIQMIRGYKGLSQPHALSGRADLETFWFMSSGWEGRADALFRLAGEVEKKVGQ